MTEQELIIDVIRRLNRSGIAYFLTGAMASNYWGIPRTTHDLDFVVQLPIQVIPNLLREFHDDFYLDEHAVRAALAPPYQFDVDGALSFERELGIHQFYAFRRRNIRL